jgi:hypothetical protein
LLLFWRQLKLSKQLRRKRLETRHHLGTVMLGNFAATYNRVLVNGAPNTVLEWTKTGLDLSSGLSNPKGPENDS